MNEFQENDVVLYGNNGACRIDTIEQRDMGAYYILTPVHKDRTTLMVPVDNERLTSRMRPMPSPQSVEVSIRKALKDEPSWIDDTNERKEHAKQVLEQGSEYELLMLARSFHAHRQHTIESGKRATTSDSTILRSAQDHIRDEFSVVFGIPPEEVDDFIGKHATSRS